METLVDAGREFWRGVLTAGGATVLPRWSAEPGTGVGELVVPVPGALVADMGRVAEESGVGVDAVMLAAHARVLATLSGLPEVVCGVATGPGGATLPCRLEVDTGPWHELLGRVAATLATLRNHRKFPVAELKAELGLAGPVFETVHVPARPTACRTIPTSSGEPAAAGLAAGVVLVVAFDPGAGRPVLRVRYRREAFDAEAAERIAGYHLRALGALCADPDGEHGQLCLLSAEEWQLQVEGLAGPVRGLPDQRVHELFERQALAHPDAVAAVHRGQEWTYGELNARANRLARTLLARGLSREGVVAVVCPRDLHWLAAVLAVFKAGGAYLPIDPDFPAERIAAVLSRAGAGLVLTEDGATANLDPALAELPGVQTLRIDAGYLEQHPAADGDPDADLRLPVAAEQLAYIYFTSGSTGAPKGAMCEHAGLVNHLLAKVDDLEIGPGTVVAQTAPQCFDISLWQLLAALVVGGRTLLVEQEAILDVPRFVDTVAAGRVTVVQLVPSYLEAVLTYLEARPRPLPDLRRVSATGEALKPELVTRWFTAGPAVPLLNAYGLTETSDDTNHHLFCGVPADGRAPLGRPIANVTVYVVDEYLQPVPLGAPGEIVFSGVCVGRGYVNDPERSAAAFTTDPYCPGRRLYRSGDHGRWAPDGTLEFLGRRDSQVKISGFRIEIGEIENALLRIPGIGDAAVVVATAPTGTKRLVAFYSGPGPLESETLSTRLAATLPHYMVPAAFHWRAALALTANSKIDRTALTVQADGLDEPPARTTGPATPTEHRLAAAWATVLGIPADQIGRTDSFFDSGGSSLTAVKLAVVLDRAVSLKDITRHPVLADLAAVVDDRTAGNGLCLGTTGAAR